jgi:hypothetical protein
MKQITPEQLELYKRLQGKLPKGWNIGDICYDADVNNFGVVTDARYSSFTAVFEDFIIMHYAVSQKALTRISILEELWNMVDWKKWGIKESILDNGWVIIHTKSLEGLYVEFHNDPTTAILKALVEQFEV